MAAPPEFTDAAHLTTILRRNGVLANGRVREVTADPPRKPESDYGSRPI